MRNECFQRYTVRNVSEKNIIALFFFRVVERSDMWKGNVLSFPVTREGMVEGKMWRGSKECQYFGYFGREDSHHHVPETHEIMNISILESVMM